MESFLLKQHKKKKKKKTKIFKIVTEPSLIDRGPYVG
jgi:hypothetical protein